MSEEITLEALTEYLAPALSQAGEDAARGRLTAEEFVVTSAESDAGYERLPAAVALARMAALNLPTGDWEDIELELAPVASLD